MASHAPSTVLAVAADVLIKAVRYLPRAVGNTAEACGQDFPVFAGMAAYNAETAIARALDSRYARADGRGLRADPRSAHHLRRHHPRPRRTAHPARPAHRAQADPGPVRPLRPAQPGQARYPGTDLVLRYEVKPHPGIAWNISLCQESWASTAEGPVAILKEVARA